MNSSAKASNLAMNLASSSLVECVHANGKWVETERRSERKTRLRCSLLKEPRWFLIKGFISFKHKIVSGLNGRTLKKQTRRLF